MNEYLGLYKVIVLNDKPTQDDISPSTSKKIETLVRLSEFIKQELNPDSPKNSDFSKVIEQTEIHNRWFSEKFVRKMLQYWSNEFTFQNIYSWLNKYILNQSNPKKIGLILAGNIPLVGFHDVICSWLSGHLSLVKCSSKDNILIPFLCKHLEKDTGEVSFKFLNSPIKNYDALIATGTNNTVRHLQYYVRNKPYIFRNNRTSVAVISGNESSETLKKLGDDIFSYYGLGCRNVSKIYVPGGYDVNNLMSIGKSLSWLMINTKYANNYTYQKAVNLLQRKSYIDCDYYLLQNNSSLHAPISMVYYEYYESLNQVLELLEHYKNEIQCIVSNLPIANSIPFGTSQTPKLWEYADGKDTLEFLNSI